MSEQDLDDADIDVLFEQVVAKLWRSVCGLMRLRMPATSAASWTARWSCRDEMGSV